MKFFTPCLALLLLATGAPTTALAGSQWSPQTRVAVLEVRETSGVLRLGVRRSMEVGAPAFDFNPANCTSLTASFNLLGTGNNVATQYFDVQLDAAGRSATEQRQLLASVYDAFITGRSVLLHVRDDLCMTEGSRVVSGIKVEY